MAESQAPPTAESQNNARAAEVGIWGSGGLARRVDRVENAILSESGHESACFIIVIVNSKWIILFSIFGVFD